jgi:hypothetical protein
LFSDSGLSENPLKFDKLELTHDSIRTPQIHVTVTNKHVRGVNAFTVHTVSWNAYGEVLKEYGYGDITHAGIHQNTIQPGETKRVTWKLYGYDTAYKVRTTIVAAVDTGDTRWDRSGDDEQSQKKATLQE